MNQSTEDELIELIEQFTHLNSGLARGKDTIGSAKDTKAFRSQMGETMHKMTQLAKRISALFTKAQKSHQSSRIVRKLWSQFSKQAEQHKRVSKAIAAKQRQVLVAVSASQKGTLQPLLSCLVLSLSCLRLYLLSFV